MTPPTDEEFASYISRAIDELPPKYIRSLDNIAITYDDVPNEHQTKKLKLRGDSLLLGLYEGIPLTQRGGSYTFVLPDKITIFKLPLAAISRDSTELYKNVKHTLWHEIAHFYGLDHDRIDEIEERWQ